MPGLPGGMRTLFQQGQRKVIFYAVLALSATWFVATALGITAYYLTMGTWPIFPWWGMIAGIATLPALLVEHIVLVQATKRVLAQMAWQASMHAATNVLYSVIPAPFREWFDKLTRR